MTKPRMVVVRASLLWLQVGEAEKLKDLLLRGCLKQTPLWKQRLGWRRRLDFVHAFVHARLRPVRHDVCQDQRSSRCKAPASHSLFGRIFLSLLLLAVGLLSIGRPETVLVQLHAHVYGTLTQGYHEIRVAGCRAGMA